jgi:hypothetical protein
MAKTKGQQVSATISPELHTALEEHRWTVRMTMTELVRTAVEEYAANHEVIPSPAEDVGDDESVAAE